MNIDRPIIPEEGQSKYPAIEEVSIFVHRAQVFGDVTGALETLVDNESRIAVVKAIAILYGVYDED